MGASALAVAVGLLLAGCSKGSDRENASVPGGGSDEPVRSGHLKVQTSVLTRSAVDGTVLPQGSAIGVVVTTTDGNAFFTPSATTGGSADESYYPDGRNVRFCNETGVNIWTSTTAEGKPRLLLFTGEDRGRVYGYYPWTDDADIEGEGSSATIPVGILNEGTIAVAAADGTTDKPAYTAAGEKDYMYSSRNDEVGARSSTTARLVMEHVLSRVSFRMYASAAAQAAVEGDENSYYEFVGYMLKNRSGSEELVARFDGNTRMSVGTGEITGALSGGEIVRRIEGYRLERSNGDMPEDDNAAAVASARVGNLCFPLAAIGHDGGKTTGIEAVFEVRRMRGDGTVASGPAAYALPLAVVPGESDKWEAGKHYTYTVKFTGGSLSVESVTVTRWNEVAGGDMNIGEDPYVSSAEVVPAGDIPVEGDTYSVTLTGLLSIRGTDVRARIEGEEEPLAEGKATTSGSAVELAVPANEGYDVRTVVFEYRINGTWTQIGDSRSQAGYSVSNATHNAPATIPTGGGTYSVTLTGILPASGVDVRATSGGTALVTGKVTASGTAVSLAVPANTTGADRTVTFEYLWNGTWTKIGDSRTQQGYKVSAATHNAPATISGQGGSYNVTLTGVLPSGVAVRAQSGGTALVSGTVPRSGTAVSLTIPGNLSYTNRTVTFEYQWNGTWTKIGADCSQPGWHVTKASVSPAGDIPIAGGTYTVTLTGWGGYQIRAMSGSAQLVIKTDYTETANYSASIVIPANTGTAARNVTFQYRFNGTWKDIETRTQLFLQGKETMNRADCQTRCGTLPTSTQLSAMDWSTWYTDESAAYWTNTVYPASQKGEIWYVTSGTVSKASMSDEYHCRCPNE
ncbi:fimbrillin family protein [Alistipes finegoldii]|uniref:fimbrillin family protein n=2 Tax=Alistipes finegoldii TaxID=214856 RepID=UPI002432E437|nr:fimbrillin family protein [Alistipes finegoldii]